MRAYVEGKRASGVMQLPAVAADDLEALAAGLPIAATAVGAIPDVISRSQCGSLCPPSNSGELAACMEREMQRAVGAGVAERAKTFAASEYGLERMTRAYARLYEEISGTRSAGAALTSS